MNPEQAFHWPIPEEYHYNRWIAERTNALLEQYQQDGEPLLLWFSFFDPHPPYLAPEPWHSMYDPEQVTIPELIPREHDNNPPHFRMTQEDNPDFGAWRESGNSIHGYHSHVIRDEQRRKQIVTTYYGMISLMDKYIGAILDKLDALGLADNTLIVFTSDQGHFFGQHGLQAKGGFHYEDLIKLPFIVRYPGVIPAGREAISSNRSSIWHRHFCPSPEPGFLTL